MKRRFLPIVLALLVFGCGDGGGLQLETTAGLEPLPVPAHLAEVDPPVRAQYEERRTLLDHLLVSDGSQPDVAALAEAYGALGMWHQAYGDHELASQAYAHALVHAPDAPRWLYYLGIVHGALGQTDTARHEMERFLEGSPDNVPARVHLAEIELDAGRSAEAKALFNAALEREDDNPQALVGLGRLALQERDFAAAAGHLERALELQPGRAQVHYSLGLAYRGLGERQRAAEHMKRGSLDNRDKSNASMDDPLMAEVRTLKQGARVHGQRARRAFVEGDFARAIEQAQKAVAANPEAPQSWLNLGAALLRADLSEEAVAPLEKALSLSPGHPIAHFNLAATLFQLGRRTEAEVNYRAAVTANPGFKEARFNLANLLRFQGDFGGALEHYETVIALDPGLAHARLWRAVCLVELGREAEARQTLEADLSSLRGNPVLGLVYARLLASARDSKVRDGGRALELAQTLYRVRPRLGEAEALATAHAERGAFPEAISWQQEALESARELAPGEALARLSRRLALYRQGKPCRQMWDVDEFKGADIPVGAP